ncbi:hypothetical protein NM208_g4104 [Fusarium decemcellulare]|uniref:Uncharacterized protein n=1 Tax=Fusarium decemcellulare TaxID=57161 RepID=A0ACC1SLT1_9HYPO|nr:hypothetical protein NM208_g4104 [Fusarium decemcellulare]
MASPPTTLTTLPFEMRRQIFVHAFKVDGGYAFNGDSEKLTMADGKPINFSLMYTCRSIANDTKGMPLSVNTINFSTVYRRDWSAVAGCFNYVRFFYRLLQEDLILRLAPFMTADMYSELGQRHPEFVAQLQNQSTKHEKIMRIWARGQFNIREEGAAQGNAFMWGPSKLRLRHHSYPGLGHMDNPGDLLDRLYGPTWEAEQITSYCLRFLAEKEPAEFSRLVYEALPQWVDKHPADEFLDLMFPPWAIPSRAEMANMTSRLEANNAWELVESWHPGTSEPYNQTRGSETWTATGLQCREKIRFSAAAVAIRFLKQLPIDQRLQVRQVTLHENLPAVCTPSVHAEGLAPFFKENQRLQVERRVSVLRCIVEENRLQNLVYPGKLGGPNDIPRFLQDPNSLRFHCRASMNTQWFSERLAIWLLEALAVLDANIPAESFTFVLEGKPWVDFCSDLFQQVVHRDVAWQNAFEASVDRGYVLSRSKLRFAHDRLEGAMEHLSKQTSILRSDFNTGHSWDIEPIIEKNRLLNERFRWRNAHGYPIRFMDFPPPLDLTNILLDHYEIQTKAECGEREDVRETVAEDGLNDEITQGHG